MEDHQVHFPAHDLTDPDTSNKRHHHHTWNAPNLARLKQLREDLIRDLSVQIRPQMLHRRSSSRLPRHRSSNAANSGSRVRTTVSLY